MQFPLGRGSQLTELTCRWQGDSSTFPKYTRWRGFTPTKTSGRSHCLLCQSSYSPQGLRSGVGEGVADGSTASTGRAFSLGSCCLVWFTGLGCKLSCLEPPVPNVSNAGSHFPNAPQYLCCMVLSLCCSWIWDNLILPKWTASLSVVARILNQWATWKSNRIPANWSSLISLSVR